MHFRPRLAAAIIASGVLVLTGCGEGSLEGGASAGASSSLTIAAGFYPLQYVAEAVGADHVTVTSLTPAGVEPHDVELSPATVRSLSDTDLVLYIKGFQPAVEDAIDSTGADAMDAASVVALAPSAESDGGTSDPHVWLDPSLLGEYATTLADEFAALDPEHASDYAKNATALRAELLDLDGAFTTGLASCKRTDFITSHEAFGYLARAYGLEQVGIAGLDPESEPSPARLREIHDIIAETGATTVFTETLVSPRVAEAVAEDSGVNTAVLDPIESVTSGDDYRVVMLRNLDALRKALDCE